MPVRAMMKGVRISPRKVQVVAALVRGRLVTDAVTILEHTPRRSAEAVKQTILSARANAEHNHGLKPDTLSITEITVTPGPRFKRYKRGRGYRGGVDRFERKTSHIKVVVDGDKRVIKKPATKKETEEKQ